MASSFDGATIRVDLDVQTASSPWWEAPVYVSRRHVPGSNADAIQDMGEGDPAVTLSLHLSAAEYAAFRPKRGATGPLVVGGVDYGTAYLESVAGVRRHIDGWITCQATFVQTAAP